MFLIIDAIILILLTIFYFFIENVYTNLATDELAIFKNLYLIVAFYSILSFPLLNLNGVLLAKERFISVKICGLLQKLMTVLLVVGGIYAEGDIYILVLANAASSLLFSLIKILLVLKENVHFKVSYRNVEMTRNLFSFSAWSTVVQVAQRCIFSLAPTILAMLADSKEIAYFSLASTVEGYVWTIGDAINGMFLPQIARLNTQENANNKISELMCRVGKFQLFVIGAIFLVFFLQGDGFVKLWLGEGYEKVAICIVFLITPTILDIPQQVGKTALLVRNKVKLEAIVYLLMICAYLPLTVMLTRYMGIIGTAISICIVYIARSLALAVIYQVVLELNIKSFFLQVYVRWGIVALIVCSCGQKINITISSIPFINLFLNIAALIVLYGIVVWIVFLKKQERQAIRDTIKSGIAKKVNRQTMEENIKNVPK